MITAPAWPEVSAGGAEPRGRRCRRRRRQKGEGRPASPPPPTAFLRSDSAPKRPPGHRGGARARPVELRPQTRSPDGRCPFPSLFGSASCPPSPPHPRCRARNLRSCPGSPPSWPAEEGLAQARLLRAGLLPCAARGAALGSGSEMARPGLIVRWNPLVCSSCVFRARLEIPWPW